MSQSLATLSHLHEIYRRPRAPPRLFQHEFERFLRVSAENVLAATAAVRGNELHEALDDEPRGHEVLEETNGPRTVKDIEDWLKNIHEPIPSTKLSKNGNSRASMERYLSEHLPEIFFDKDFIAKDSTLMNKTLNINYDAIFNDIQNEKIIFSSEKDNVFIFPDLQLDNLDQLSYCTDDVILTSESLPSFCEQLPCTNVNLDTKDLIMRLQETINFISGRNKIVNESNDNQTDSDVMNLEDGVQKDFCIPLGTNEVPYHKSNINNLNSCSDAENNEHAYTIEPLDPTSPTRLHIKFKRVHPNEKTSVQPIIDKEANEILDKVCTRSKRKSLSVDNNLTDKCSNSSLAASKHSEVLKCRSSERIKSRKRLNTSDSQESEQENRLSFRPIQRSQPQELAISKALEGVGITDDKLQYFKSKDNIKIWECHQSNCKRQFDKLSGLRVHLLTHFGIKPFKCDYDECMWAFYSNDKLLRHKEFHMKNKEFICSKSGCRRRFSTMQNLALHEKSHLRPYRVVCQVSGCSAKFQTQKYMEMHMKTHDGVLPLYICSKDNCNKRFYTKNVLMAHERCHNQADSDLTCSWTDCGKTFKHPPLLKIHMLSHTGHKPYVCTFKGCKWAFSTSSKLSRHQKKHTNDRNFVCDIGDCKKSYLRSDHLREHKLTHTGNRGFECDYCDATFNLKNNLYAHIKKHSNKNFISRVRNKASKNKKKNVSKKTEIYCSRVQPITINRLKETMLNDVSVNGQSTTNRKSTARVTLCAPNLSIPTMEGKENNEDMYYCPVDTCTKFYPTKSSLRIHLQRKHKRPLSEIQNHDEIRRTSSSRLPLDNRTMKDSPQDSDVQGSSDFEETEEMVDSETGNQGSARTAFTFQVISNLKPKKIVKKSNVPVNETVLGVDYFNESLLLTDDLPSMCCQDDINVGAYQTLLVEPTDNEISMYGLE